MCSHHLNDGVLVCNRETPHNAPKGCTYAASAGADLDGPHRHVDQEESG